MIAGMNGVVIAGDLFNLFVFLEVASMASYALVAFGTEHEEVEAGFKYLVLGSIGSVFVLFGIGFLYNQTGQLNMAAVANTLFGKGTNRIVMLSGAFLLVGFGLKAALVPLHAWLPDAHPAAPAPVSAMLSGVLIKALGIYAMTRVLFNVLVPTAEIISVVIGMGTLSMLVGAFLMTGQDDFKRLLAYCSIGQVGFIVTAIGVGAHALFVRGETSLAAFALFGALFHLFNHAIFKALLFLTSGAVEYSTGIRSLALLGGLRKVMPVTAGCCRVGALSISGIPPFAGFFSKVVVILAIFQARLWFIGIAAALEAAVTLVAFLKLQRRTIEGPLPSSLATVVEVPHSMRVALIILAAVALLAGPGVVWFREWIVDPAAESLTAEVSGYVSLFLPQSSL
jgi:multicomponent Na+:H+ antiporter subunit D